MLASLAKLFFHAGARMRNPSLTAEYRRVKESEWFSRTRLEALQLERTARFLEFAERHSPYHRRVFGAHGFSAARFSSLEDLRRLPVLTKQILIGENAAIHTVTRFPKLFLAETSGTSGSALEFRKNERWDSTNRAHLMRAYDWYGVKPWDRNGYLWGYDIAPERARRVRAVDALQNRFRLFRYDPASIRSFALKLRSAHFISGYSSMIYETAKLINALGLEPPKLQMVKGTSEMILDVYQAEAERAFGRRIVSEYGAAEAGLIAFECPRGRMHINVEDVVVEVDDEGEILVTNLASHSFPIIRYRLGDSVRLSDELCPCGRQHPVVREIMGRRGASVVGRTGRYPALTFYYVFKNLALRHGILLNYKAVQEEQGTATLTIEGTGSRVHEPLVRGELEKYFGDDVSFELRYVDAIERSMAKAQYFESRLPS